MATGPDLQATALKNAVTHISLHTASPGTTGASEVSGSGYARKSVSWGAVSAGVVSSSAALSFVGPASGAAKFWGGWTAVSGDLADGDLVVTGNRTGAAATNSRANMPPRMF